MQVIGSKTVPAQFVERCLPWAAEGLLQLDAIIAQSRGTASAQMGAAKQGASAVPVLADSKAVPTITGDTDDITAVNRDRMINPGICTADMTTLHKPFSCLAAADAATAAASRQTGSDARSNAEWLAIARHKFSVHVRRVLVLAMLRQAGDLTLCLQSIFARIWNTFMRALREGDLISDREHGYLVYGPGFADGPPQLPLFLYTGQIRSFIGHLPQVMQVSRLQ
jgi:hypothetical protein